MSTKSFFAEAKFCFDNHLMNSSILSTDGSSNSVRNPQGLCNILDEVQHVLEYDDNDVEPTPIGPLGVKVVDVVSVAENSWHEDGALLKALDPLLSSKRKIADNITENVPSCPTVKKQRIHTDPVVSNAVRNTQDSPNDESFMSTEDANALRFRSYQSEQWFLRLLDLVQFQKTHGHCLVPHTYDENPSLAQWVKRQRYQRKLKLEGRHSTLTKERENALETLGFIWDSHRAAWEERLHELRHFKEINGHCNVPTSFPENRQLAVWVKCQRRQHKLFMEGERSNMTQERIENLRALGFVFNPRQPKDSTL